MIAFGLFMNKYEVMWLLCIDSALFQMYIISLTDILDYVCMYAVEVGGGPPASSNVAVQRQT